MRKSKNTRPKTDLEIFRDVVKDVEQAKKKGKVPEVVKEVQRATKEGKLKSRTLEELEDVAILICDVKEKRSFFGLFSSIEVIGWWADEPFKIVITSKPLIEMILEKKKKESLPFWATFHR